MTTPADTRAAEEAFEACLAGRPAPGGAEDLAAFTDAVRASATTPGRPNAALAELLATGLLVPNQKPSRGTAGQPVRTSRKRHRMFLPALVAKFASTGAVAKAAVGAGVVLVAFTGAAAAEVLPDPVQSAVEEVVVVPGGVPGDDTAADDTAADDTAADDTAADDSPTQTPGTEGESAEGTTEGETSGEDGEAVDAVTGDDTGTGHDTDTEGGDETTDPATAPAEDPVAGPEAEEAKVHPDNHGAVVSQRVHERNDARKAAHDERKAEQKAGRQAAPVTEAPAPVVEQPSAPQEPVVQSAPAVAATAVGDRGNGHGNGNGNGHGHGHGNGNGNGKK